MGLLDLPAPVFAALDDGMAWVLPPTPRLALWAAIAGTCTLLLYRALSPQARIGRAKRTAREARQRLNRFDGEFADAGPLIKEQFVAAFKHLGLVLPSTLLSILPLLALLVWIETAYGYTYPAPGNTPTLTTVPGEFQSDWIGEGKPPEQNGERSPLRHILVRDDEGVITEVVLTAPVPVIAQRQWWNWLVANPLGYLPENSALRRIEIALPQQTYLPFGPPWVRSWMVIFFPVMLIVSLLVYRWARIE
ncbi:hypothetical protein [Halomonas sp. M20]|uniref:hypothetical protein n=1 Tax=Halomonas sp. M20 TaxID=2763264 RepID=UPI001D0BDE25|nr:hypothetical protein [Halomonas sp. M20]